MAIGESDNRAGAALVIAAPTSGSGKTTITTGLLRALRRRGLVVQPFKAGPDYIDPSYHTRAAGRPCRNLDTWMVPPDALRALYERTSAGATVNLIEGVMGLFDGRGGGEEGSTAHLAKLLDLPVVVVIDVGRTSTTAGAIALGVQSFDRSLDVVGFILNRVASENHRRWASDAITKATGLPVLGGLPRRDELALPERHLGLIPTAEGQVSEEFFEQLANQCEQSFDLDRLLALARPKNTHPGNAEPPGLFPTSPQPVKATIGLAIDAAFSFYYADNLDLLRDWGARLVPFSPLHDSALPDGIDALYIGGGFPELYARELAANQAMVTALRAVAAAGMPIYAECGGLMYLSEGITDFDGQRFSMVGLVPAWSAMVGRRLTLGYRELQARGDTPLLRQGESARGHEFHWSTLERPLLADDAAYAVLGAPITGEGFARGNLLASYCHLHFASNPVLAPNFIATASRWRRQVT
ncbi:MAG TPA: cobyrinate a,c-diamide synthase [Candidatus Saccharimonadales bacterium]|nr:cobyrinate a,c-diamide synthase [Candidatus Saccharimonadales bacterium]